MAGGFTPGAEFNAAFYADVVRPVLRGQDHAAALLGWGSDVLGYDTERSTDHGWGPRLLVFVDAADVVPVRRIVDANLPETYDGLPIRFGWDDTPVRHHVEVTTLGDWLVGHLGIDPRCGLDSVDWLTLPQQLLLGVTSGAVYADPHGELAAVRSRIAWYPGDVWLWMLASQWNRLDQEEPFVGRTAEAGDELGSRLIAARLVRELMRLAFLQERTYWPYSKWFGTAFSRLPGAAELTPALEAATDARDYPSREAGLIAAATILATRHHDLGVTPRLDSEPRRFHSRPYRVIGAGRFAAACRDAIADDKLRSMPLVGSVDQFADSTDILSVPGRPKRMVRFTDDERPPSARDRRCG